jgi:hypothetical protein
VQPGGRSRPCPGGGAQRPSPDVCIRMRDAVSRRSWRGRARGSLSSAGCDFSWEGAEGCRAPGARGLGLGAAFGPERREPPRSGSPGRSRVNTQPAGPPSGDGGRGGNEKYIEAQRRPTPSARAAPAGGATAPAAWLRPTPPAPGLGLRRRAGPSERGSLAWPAPPGRAPRAGWSPALLFSLAKHNCVIGDNEFNPHQRALGSPGPCSC